MNGSQVLIAGAAVISLMPLILSITTARRGFGYAAAFLCLCSIAGLVISTTLGGLFGVGLMGGIFGILWFASLLCGIAALNNRMADRRANEMIFRLLNNDGEKLQPPSEIRHRYVLPKKIKSPL